MSDFEELVRAHQAAVCATAYAMLRDRARSEEIAQDAFLVAWKKLPELSPPPAMPAWICGIARNLARNALRKHREVAMSDTTPEPAATTTPLDATLTREHIDLASRALATLSDDDREVVVLYYRADESIRAVAAALDIAEPAARKRLQRTRERLRDALSAVESTLRQTRPGPAFTVACVAALAAGRAVDASAAAAPASAAKPALLLAAAAVVLVGGALAVRVATHATAAPSSDPAAGSSAQIAASPNESPAPSATGSSRVEKARELVQRISAAERAAIVSRVHARDVPAAPPVEPLVYDFSGSRLDDTSTPEPPKVIDRLNKGSMRYAIRLMLPMVRACTNDHTPHGTIDVRMHLGGDAQSTIVESIEITGHPPLSEDTEFIECVRTTMLTLELPPRDDPAKPWDVNYPLTL
ncbi:MAG: sigma-70 family RNA polymerase sigma factor [Deltaproteobacteria bacterium]|nr:sigma-70 family RNA polymerase sigma factor [Deltaproteobacteria bacterium]